MGLFRKGKTKIIAKFYRTDLVIYSHSREGKTLSYSHINTVSGYYFCFYIYFVELYIFLSSIGKKMKNIKKVKGSKIQSDLGLYDTVDNNL